METIRVGIIGQGRSGRDIHGATLARDPQRFKIMAVADLLDDRRRRARAEYRCDAYADYRALLKRKDIDLIVNAAPSNLHAPVTVECLRAGLHVLCEKPLAATVQDVDRMIAAAQKARKVLAAFQQSHYTDAFLQVRKVVDSGVLGRLVQVSAAYNGFSRRWDWQTLQRCDGGNLLNTGPHPMEQMLQLYGAGMPQVFCFMDRANTVGDAEDHVKVVLRGAGHPLIDLEISSCCAYPSFTYNIYGTRGGLKADQKKAEWKYFKSAEAPRLRLTVRPICNPDGTPAYCREPLQWHTGQWPEVADGAGKSAAYNPATAAAAHSQATNRYYDMLYRTLTQGVPLEITLSQIRRMIAVMQECQRQNPQIYRRRKQSRK